MVHSLLVEGREGKGRSGKREERPTCRSDTYYVSLTHRDSETHSGRRYQRGQNMGDLSKVKKRE